jgi:hypothetical protein
MKHEYLLSGEYVKSGVPVLFDVPVLANDEEDAFNQLPDFIEDGAEDVTVGMIQGPDALMECPTIH